MTNFRFDLLDCRAGGRRGLGVMAISKKFLGLAIATAAFGCVSRAGASIIYDNINPTQPFGSGRSIQGSNQFGGINDPAYSFVSPVSVSLSEIDIAIFGFGPVTIEVKTAAPLAPVFSGEADIQPGTLLGSWNLTPDTDFNVSQITGITGVDLVANTTYFLQAAPASNTTMDFWANNNTGARSVLWQCSGSNATYTACVQHAALPNVTDGAFELQGPSAIPEPSTWAMMLAGILGVGILARRRTRLSAAA